MVTAVSDSRSNANDQIAHAARMLAGSRHRRLVFQAVYAGKSAIKTVPEVMSSTGLTQKQVLTAGKALARNHIVVQTRHNGTTGYEKDGFYSDHRNKILRLANRPGELAALPTKTNPQSRMTVSSTQIQLPKALVQVNQVTVDDIDSFARVKGIRIRDYAARPLTEATFKHGLQSLLREEGTFRDWGGERNDLWTTRLTYKGRRRAAVFAFKGKGTTGRLTPKKMGANGDQILRLFQAPAEFFVVQYWREIDQSIVELMRSLAVAKSVLDGRQIHFGVMDGQDSQRLMRAYPGYFDGGS